MTIQTDVLESGQFKKLNRGGIEGIPLVHLFPG
jgi:hypothetical protein